MASIMDPLLYTRGCSESFYEHQFIQSYEINTLITSITHNEENVVLVGKHTTGMYYSIMVKTLGLAELTWMSKSLDLLLLFSRIQLSTHAPLSVPTISMALFQRQPSQGP